MGTGIVLGDVAVPTFGQETAIGIDQQRTDRNLIILTLGPIGQRQRMAHPTDIDRSRAGKRPLAR